MQNCTKKLVITLVLVHVENLVPHSSYRAYNVNISSVVMFYDRKARNHILFDSICLHKYVLRTAFSDENQPGLTATLINVKTIEKRVRIRQLQAEHRGDESNSLDLPNTMPAGTSTKTTGLINVQSIHSFSSR